MSFCRSCQKLIPGGYEELAKHIMSSKTSHRKGRKWAAGYLLKVKSLDRKVTLQSRPGRAPLTDEQKETKKNLVRNVSGRFERVLAVCPKCKHGHTLPVEVEYLESETVWKSESGKPFILCSWCR